MAVYKWVKCPNRNFGDIWVPFAHLELQGSDGQYHKVAVQVDSGAVVSLLRRSVADVLGFSVQAGKPIELESVGGAQTTAHLHELRTRFGEDLEFSVPYAIADTESVPNLLGRLGVFDRLQIVFDARLHETRVTPCGA